MKRIHDLICLVTTVGGLLAQDPIAASVLAGSAPHGIAGALAGSERWVVHFRTRAFDLQGFRQAILGRRPADEVAAIVRDLEQRVIADQKPFADAVAGLGGRVTQQWWLVNAAAIEVTQAQLDAVRRLPNIAFVQPDEVCVPTILTATNASNHNADAVQALGFRGQGATLGIVDSGQDSNMGGTGRPHRAYFVNGDPNNLSGGGIGGSRLLVNRQIGLLPADDSQGHGTGVASIGAGANWGTAGADDGHAPLAGIAGYAIADAFGGSSSLVTEANAWQQLAADRAAFGIVAANMSYTSSPNPLDVSSQAMDSAALNADVMYCVAAANTGASTSVSAAAVNGLAVAAVDPNTHTVAAFSARGPLAGDLQRFYPDIAACGVNTVMARLDNEGADYVDYGTSMASPQVAGAATQLRARFPAMTALETKAVLLAGAHDLAAANPTLDRNAYGMGLLRNDRTHDIAAAGSFGTATVQTGSPQTFVMPVTIGRSYQIAIAWHRRDLASTNWSDLDLAALDANSTVLAGSASPRNLYELVRVTPGFTGNLTLRTTAASIAPGTQETFAYAWREIVIPVAGSVVDYGSGCAPTCNPLNGDGGTLLPQTQIGEFAYDLVAATALQVTGFEVFTGSVTGQPVSTIVALYQNTGGVINPTFGRVATMTIGSAPGFHRATFATPVAVPAGPFWIGLNHGFLSTYLSNLTAGTTAGGYQRPSALTGAWTRSPLTLRPAFRIHCQSPTLGGLPACTVPTVPRINAMLTFHLEQGPILGAAVMALGTSNTTSGLGPLPLSMAPYGAPACTLLTNADFDLSLQFTDSLGAANYSVFVPNDGALVGVHGYGQWLVVATGANFMGLTFSNGRDVMLGNQ